VRMEEWNEDGRLMENCEHLSTLLLFLFHQRRWRCDSLKATKHVALVYR
jgi:hypothetical protein